MKLIVVTDIFSRPSASQCLSTKLSGMTSVTRFALCDLCGRSDLSGKALHNFLFDQSGIVQAVQTLLKQIEPGVVGLGYSAGGTALWQAARNGARLKGLFCISSTRLRTEAEIAVHNHVFYGALDEFKPPANWLEETPDGHTVFEHVGHDYYLDSCSEAADVTSRKITAELEHLQ